MNCGDDDTEKTPRKLALSNYNEAMIPDNRRGSLHEALLSSASHLENNGRSGMNTVAKIMQQ